MESVILHCDMNNYYASVESVEKPWLRTVPMAVCGDPALRHGIVLAKNDEAKKYGILTGESSYAAMMKCPGLNIVRPDYKKYLRFSNAARTIYGRYTDKIYPYGLDEAWLDVTEAVSPSGGRALADELRGRIREELGITASVGVSFNYVFAKLASELKKPDATSVLPHERLRDTVWGMPAFTLLFVGPATKKELCRIGILTIGDIARSDPSYLCSKLGKKGRMLWEFANGDDSSFDPTATGEDDIKSVGNSVTPPKDIRNARDAAAFLYLLSDAVSRRLKKHGFVTSRVGISVRRDDFSQISRQKPLVSATDDAEIIFGNVCDLLYKNHNWEHNIRSIGVKADRIEKPLYEQTSLFGYKADASVSAGLTDTDIRKLTAEIKKKYGSVGFEETALQRDPELNAETYRAGERQN